MELLARVAHDLAGLGEVVHIDRKFEQGELASRYIVLHEHVVSPDGLDCFLRTDPYPGQERHGHTRPAHGRLGYSVNCQVTTVSAQNDFSRRSMGWLK